MFGKVIYFDREAFNDCLAVIDGKMPRIVGERTKRSTKNIGFKMTGFDAGLTGEEESYTYSVESLLLNCINLEEKLSGRDDYYDATSSSDLIDIKTIGRGSVLKCDCSVAIPEAFDTTQLIDDFKALLIPGMDKSIGNINGAEQVKSMIDSAEISRIPIELESSGVLLCSKLDVSKLFIDYKDLEDYEYDELSVLLRIINNGMTTMDKPYYDPLKDYLRLNRKLRRSIKDSNNTICPIKPEQDYKTVDVIAIYQ